uniref:Zinc finger protein ZPR1 n=2 Tax=Cacopsylla melanoneura TaxID=428564 RepID=A0A8D8R8Z7_9HEMI
MGESKPLFRDLTAEDPDPETTEIESLCMNCGDNGTTRLLLTRIPFFKEVVLMSFDCPHCDFKNNEIQPGGRIEEKGVRIKLKVETQKDLNRNVVKSDFTAIKIPELDFEIPSQSQKGEVTTVEGVLDRIVRGLSQDQETRRKEHAEAAAQIDAFIDKVTNLKQLESPFTMILEDISGNTFISNPNAPHVDVNLESHPVQRNKDQDHLLGIFSHDEVDAVTGEKTAEPTGNTAEGVMKSIAEGEFTYDNMLGEVMQFPTNCSQCGTPCMTNMKMTNIPHFKEVIIMATTCDACGNRTNEVKSGGGIEPKGIKIEVCVSQPEDFSRDVLKSDSCYLYIPEVELEVGPAALGGKFTTVEGLLRDMKDQLADKGSMFSDSADTDTATRMTAFLQRLEDILTNKEAITLILDDPAGNSYVQSKSDDGEPDSGLKITSYERSYDQNDELGLNDMRVDNYQLDSVQEEFEEEES